MPNTTSAKKALRQSESRRIRNFSVKRGVKKTIKEYVGLLESGQLEEAGTKLSTVYKALDKAARRGVIKKNKASRLKSRLSSRLKRAGVTNMSETTSGAESQT